MHTNKFASILIVFALFLGQASASVNFDFKANLVSYGSELNIASMINCEESRDQKNCACVESECSASLMLDCNFGVGSARCAPVIFGTLVVTQLFPMSDQSSSAQVGYDVPIYHDISSGVILRPPIPVV